MLRKKIRKSQGGFTLIEIIAVLVILGILAAVAVPRFLDLQTESQNRAMEGAIAAGVSNATLAFSRYILVNGSAPTAIASNAWSGSEGISQNIETDLGDFTAEYTYSTPDVTVTLSAGPSWFDSSSATKTKTFPIQ